MSHSPGRTSSRSSWPTAGRSAWRIPHLGPTRNSAARHKDLSRALCRWPSDNAGSGNARTGGTAPERDTPRSRRDSCRSILRRSLVARPPHRSPARVAGSVGIPQGELAAVGCCLLRIRVSRLHVHATRTVSGCAVCTGADFRKSKGPVAEGRSELIDMKIAKPERATGGVHAFDRSPIRAWYSHDSSLITDARLPEHSLGPRHLASRLNQPTHDYSCQLSMHVSRYSVGTGTIRPAWAQPLDRVDETPDRHAKIELQIGTKIGSEALPDIVLTGGNGVKKRRFIREDERLVFGIWLDDVDEQPDLSVPCVGLDRGRLLNFSTAQVHRVRLTYRRSAASARGAPQADRQARQLQRLVGRRLPWIDSARPS